MAPAATYYKVLTKNGVHFNGYTYTISNTTNSIHYASADNMYVKDDTTIETNQYGTCRGSGLYICTKEQVPYWVDLYSNMMYVCEVTNVSRGSDESEPRDDKVKVESFDMDTNVRELLIDFLPTILTDSSSGDEWLEKVISKNQFALKFMTSNSQKLTTSEERILVQLFTNYPAAWQNIQYVSIGVAGTDLEVYATPAYITALAGYFNDYSSPSDNDFKGQFYDLLVPFNNTAPEYYVPFTPSTLSLTQDRYKIFSARESPYFECQPNIRKKGLVIPERPVTDSIEPRPTFTAFPINNDAITLGLRTGIASYVYNNATWGAVYSITSGYYHFTYSSESMQNLSKPTLTGTTIDITDLINLQYCGSFNGVRCFILTGYLGADFKIYRIDDDYNGTSTVTNLSGPFADNFGDISNVKKILSYTVDSITIRFLVACTIIIANNYSQDHLLDITVVNYSNESVFPSATAYAATVTTYIGPIYDLKYDTGEAGSTVIAVGSSTAYTYNLFTPGFTEIGETIGKNYRTACFLANKWVFVGNDSENGPIALDSGLINPTQQTFVGDVTTNTFVYSWASPNYVYFIARDSVSPGYKATLFRWDPIAEIIYPVVYNGGYKPFIAGNGVVTDVLAGYSDGIVLRNAESEDGAGDALYILYDANIHVAPSGGGETVA